MGQISVTILAVAGSNLSGNQHPDITLCELCDALAMAEGVQVHHSSIAALFIEMRQQLIDQKGAKKMAAEHLSPRPIKKPAPLLTQFRSAIKQTPGPPVTQWN